MKMIQNIFAYYNKQLHEQVFWFCSLDCANKKRFMVEGEGIHEGKSVYRKGCNSGYDKDDIVPNTHPTIVNGRRFWTETEYTDLATRGLFPKHQQLCGNCLLPMKFFNREANALDGTTDETIGTMERAVGLLDELRTARDSGKVDMVDDVMNRIEIDLAPDLRDNVASYFFKMCDIRMEIEDEESESGEDDETDWEDSEDK